MTKTKSVAAIEIGRRIREARQKLGISREYLSELSELETTSIGRIERGESSPAVQSIVRIAFALGADPGNFISGITPDAYAPPSHQLKVRDLIRQRREQLNNRG